MATANSSRTEQADEGSPPMWGKKPKRTERSVDAIAARIAREGDRATIAREDERTGRSTVSEHSAPRRMLTIGQARQTMQEHRECDRTTCPRKMAAVNVLVAAGLMTLAPRARY